jgi:uncharacterized membrane protein YvbJ
MVEAIIALVSTLIVFFIRRRMSREKTRAEKLEQALKDVDKSIADGDVDAINSSLELSLRKLSLRDGDRRQQKGGEAAER